MASIKVLSLAIRTLAKPISTKLKQQAQEHETFRNFCINVAQTLHRSEMRMRVNLLGETSASGGKPNIRALSETKAIATGANFISESFLFAVAVSLIMAETYRGSRKEQKRRDLVADRLDAVEAAMQAVQEQQSTLLQTLQESQAQHHNLTKVLGGVVDIGMRHGEMERILARDPELKYALSKLEEDQREYQDASAGVALALDAKAAPTQPSDSPSSEQMSVASPSESSASLETIDSPAIASQEIK